MSLAFRKARVVGERDESGGSGRSRVEFSGRIIGDYVNAGRVMRFPKLWTTGEFESGVRLFFLFFSFFF